MSHDNTVSMAVSKQVAGPWIWHIYHFNMSEKGLLAVLRVFFPPNSSLQLETSRTLILKPFNDNVGMHV